MYRIKTSLIWKIDKQKLKKLVKKSNTFTQILKYFSLSPKGGNTRTLKSRLINDKINFSHISQGRNSNKGKNFIKEKRPLSEILVENSNYNRGSLKRRLIQDKLLKEICYICKLKPIWEKKRLVLVIDHINGISNDNRLCNLRLLCPNCNSQTINFAGRNKHY